MGTLDANQVSERTIYLATHWSTIGSSPEIIFTHDDLRLGDGGVPKMTAESLKAGRWWNRAEVIRKNRKGRRWEMS